MAHFPIMQHQRAKMKIFIEVLKKVIEDKKIKYRIKTKTETTLAKAQKALSDLEISNSEKKRIHKCYHDEHPPKPCEIIN